MRPSSTGHSPDGKWWHDGTTWLPAISPDALMRFDGQRWRRNEHRLARPLLTVGLTLVGVAALP